MYVHMLFYQVGKSLSPVIPAPAVPETPFVAVLGQTELSGAPLPEQMAAHHLGHPVPSEAGREPAKNQHPFLPME